MMLVICLSSSAVIAADEKQENYGVGILCPRADVQVSFYTENDQQEAAGTIAFGADAFTVTSESVKSLKSADAGTMEKLCEGGGPGIRIDSKRDGWLQAGKMWLPPGQEWDYADWQDYLHKAPIWKPITPLVLYQGTVDEPYRDKPYSPEAGTGKIEIYPLKFVDNYALVLLDKTGAFAKACAGEAVPPEGKLGWLPLTTQTGGPVAVPVHPGRAC